MVAKRILLGAIVALLLLAAGCSNQLLESVREEFLRYNGDRDITVSVGDTAIGSGGQWSAPVVFLTGETVDLTFTVANSGSGILTLTNSPPAASSNSEVFAITTQPQETLESGADSPMVVSVTPTEAGSQSTTITIASDDPDTPSFQFDILINAVASEFPILTLEFDSETVSDDELIDHGFSSLNEIKELEFSIQNTGTADLHLTGDPYRVEVTGGTDWYSIQAEDQPGSPLTPWQSTTFIIQFSSGAIANGLTGHFSIESDDPDLEVMTFSLVGNCIRPSISVDQNDQVLADGSGSIDIGGTIVDTDLDTVFTISNPVAGAGTLVLNDTDPIQISGTDADCFAVVQEPSRNVVNGGETNWTLRFTPDGLGSRTAAISIPYNDDTGATPYTFTVTGTGEPWHGFVSIDTDGVLGQYTDIDVNGSDIYISYVEDLEDLYYVLGNLKCAHSSDGGETWTHETIDESLEIRDGNAITISTNGVHISYYNSVSGDIIVASSIEGGAWSSLVVESGAGSNTDIIADGTTLYLCYRSSAGELKVAISEDEGVSWDIATAAASAGGYDSSLVLDGNDVFVPHAASQLDFAHSPSGGADGTWTSVRASSLTFNEYIHADVDDGTVYTSHLSSKVLRLTTTDDKGSTFTTTDIPTAYEVAYYTGMDVEDRVIYLAHLEYSGGRKFMMARSSDGGANWTFGQIGTQTSSRNYPSLAAVGETLYVAFYHESTSGLWLAKSIDGGETW